MVGSLIKCHLVHGYNVKDGGEGTIDQLIPYLDDRLVVVQHDYGYLKIRGVLRKNKAIAAKIKNHLGCHDVAIGHSNGCAILVKCLKQGANLDKLILINPALEKNFIFPDSVNEIHVFHSPNDKAVVAAKWLRKLLFWRSDFLWGEMGNTGYKGDDKRVINHEMKTKHSGLFNEKNIEAFSVMINDIINN